MAPNASAPIGYWLKLAHDLIDARQADALRADGVHRSHWQVLNLVDEDEPASPAAVLATMRTFVDDAGLDAVVADLVERGWLRRSAGGLRLTPEGAATRTRLLERVRAVRQRMMSGISGDDYVAVVTALQRMVANLDAA